MSDEQYHIMRMNGMSPSGLPVREFQASELTDLDPMPFGMHKGKPMQDVPAAYLHYLWASGKNQDKTCPVARYIRKNLDALRKEHKDGIWS